MDTVSPIGFVRIDRAEVSLIIQDRLFVDGISGREIGATAANLPIYLAKSTQINIINFILFDRFGRSPSPARTGGTALLQGLLAARAAGGTQVRRAGGTGVIGGRS
jgi:hypothetical protein